MSTCLLSEEKLYRAKQMKICIHTKPLFSSKNL